jgi:hypothetical protein
MIFNRLATIQSSASVAGICVTLTMVILRWQVLFNKGKIPFPVKIEAKNEIK